MDEASQLLSEKRDRIGVLTLNRPERRNALSPRMLIELHEALESWGGEDEIRAVVIRGSGGKAFSAGYDISAIPTDVTPEIASRLRDRNPLQLALESVKHFPYPTIAMLNGHCFGAAVHLALCCDLRVGADDIAVGIPPARLGVVYPHEGIAQVAQVVGMARAREIFFTGRSYRGEGLRAIGLVEQLVPRGELEATVFELAEEISTNAPLSLKGMKRILNLIEGAVALSGEARREAEALFAAVLRSDDAKEGQKAFVEKRKPSFAGR
jgi:enoyl-CoA hydratase/carnithine racemase